MLSCAAIQLCASEPKVGIVNFSNCIVESKLGKQEQNAFETMHKQLVSLIEDKNKQFQEASNNLEDKDYLDGLSKEAEDQLRAKKEQLGEELARDQQQYYQFMHQGQNKIMKAVFGGISQAAEQIASAKGYQLIINKEACFFSSPSIDVTNEIIKTMDQNFEAEESKQSEKTKN